MARTRSRGTTIANFPVSYRTTGQYRNGGPVKQVDELRSANGTFSNLEQMSDTVTPGYFAKRRDRRFLDVNECTSSSNDVPMQPLTLSVKTTLISNPDFWTDVVTVFDSWPLNPFTHGDLDPDGQPPDPDSVYADALANTLGDLWDMGTFLAEAGKTADMFKGLLRRVLLEYRKIRRSIQRGSPSKVIESVSRIWLEARYGWRPTYYDFLDISLAVERLREGVMDELVRRSITLESTEESSRSGGSFPSPYWTASYRVNKATRYVSRAGAIGQINTRIPASIDPIVTGWEVIPFSFVIDWFINVGSILQVITPFSKGEILGGWVSSFSEVTSSFEVLPRRDPAYEVSYKMDAPWICRRRTYHREPRSRSDAGLRLRLNLDLLKSSDLAALFLARNGNKLNTRR